MSLQVAVASAAGIASWLTPRAAAVSGAFTLVTGMSVPLLPVTAASIVLAPILLYYALMED